MWHRLCSMRSVLCLLEPPNTHMPLKQYNRLNLFSYANDKGFKNNKAKLGKAPYGFLAASQAQQTPELWGTSSL